MCEGENTEPQYFEKLADFYRNQLVEVDVAKRHGVPKTLVEVAIKVKETAATKAKLQSDVNLKFDLVWCVCDIDDHPNIPEAIALAARNDIKMAISNPCFELWLLLHHRDAPGLQHRDQTRGMLKSFVKNYDKNVDFKHYCDGYKEAVVRAKRLDAAARKRGDVRPNPSTNVYELTERILPKQAAKNPTKTKQTHNVRTKKKP